MILTEEERKFLIGLINFFSPRYTIIYFGKVKANGDEVIQIGTLEGGAFNADFLKDRTAFLGMKLGIPYTLRRLGLEL